MKKVLALSLVVVFALSGAAFAAVGGHVAPEVNTPIQVPLQEIAPEALDALNAQIPGGVTQVADAGAGAAPEFIREHVAGHIAGNSSFAGREVTPTAFSRKSLPGLTSQKQYYAFAVSPNHGINVDHWLYVGSVNDFPENDYFIYVLDGSMQRAPVITAGGTYFVVFEADVSAPFVINNETQLVVLSRGEVTQGPGTSSGGGGGGCNAGLPLIGGVLALSALLFIKRK